MTNSLQRNFQITVSVSFKYWKLCSTLSAGKEKTGRTALKIALLTISRRTKLTQIVAITLIIVRVHSAPGPIPILQQYLEQTAFHSQLTLLNPIE